MIAQRIGLKSMLTLIVGAFLVASYLNLQDCTNQLDEGGYARSCCKKSTCQCKKKPHKSFH